MVPSRFVRRSLESGGELGELENMAFRIRDANPASRLFSSEQGGDLKGGYFWALCKVALPLGSCFRLVSQDVASPLSCLETK